MPGFSQRLLPPALFAGALAFLPHEAEAQVHWDAVGHVGVLQRFPNDLDGRPGPTGMLAAHVAILPLLRAGVYLTGDYAPVANAPERFVFSGGFRAKLLSPWPSSPHFRAWLFGGIGYALLNAPGVTVVPSGPTSETAGAGVASQGSFAEVPVGIGFGYRLRRPWELQAELGTRFGFAFGGTYFDAAPATSGAPGRQTSTGESVGLSLTVGIAFDG
jgi:hypothetical protein